MKKWKGYIDSSTVREVNDRIRFLERALLVERARAILTFDSSIRQDMYDNWRDADDEVQEEQLDQARRELEAEGTLEIYKGYPIGGGFAAKFLTDIWVLNKDTIIVDE